MKIYLNRNPRTLILTSKTHALLFRYTKSSSLSSNSSRTSVHVELLDLNVINLSRKGLVKLSKNEIHGFLGLINIGLNTFLCAITSKYQVATPLAHHSINRILSVEFFCLNDAKWDNYNLNQINTNNFINNNYNNNSINLSTFDTFTATEPNINLIDHPCLDLQKLLSNGSFYYSSDFDLTNNLETRGVVSNSLSFDNYQDEYMWNSFMMTEMIQFRNKSSTDFKKILDNNGFLTTVIRGFAKTFQSNIKQYKADLTLISKQSWKRAGTRYNARGVDDDSNVANFVETEIILHLIDHIVFSFVQIRGSIPLFWEQETQSLNLSTPKVQITRSLEATTPIFLKHFEDLMQNYGSIHVVNLLSKSKSSEVPLSKSFSKLIHYLNNLNKNQQPVDYCNFDFHQETKTQGYQMAKRVIPLIKSNMYLFGYFSYDLTQQQTLSRQKGAFRTNCLDCLDRTNLIQQVISNAILDMILDDYKLVLPSEFDFFKKHNVLWADNGDQISQIYTGTNALKSSFSRSGKMSLSLALSDATKSVSRMYINNFVDKGRQLTIDTLLGRLAEQSPVHLFDPIADYVNDELSKIESKFTTFENLNIFVGTFNVNGLTPNFNKLLNEDDPLHFIEWLFPIKDKFIPDIFIIGFQEVIELNAASILNSDNSQSIVWQDIIGDVLNKYGEDKGIKFSLIRAEQMSSLIFLFFLRTSKVENIKRVEGSNKKTGLMGISGNKGAVAIRFNYGSTSFCFINSHLAAGRLNVKDRNDDYLMIVHSLKFTKNQSIFNHEAIIWLGDLNYRVELDNFEVRGRLEDEENVNFEDLLNYDQLLAEIDKNGAFRNFDEMEIKFRPTYKFDNNTNRYDTSEKQRVPSWTDRVLYRGNALKPLAYNSIPTVMFSDHKPVFAAFKATAKVVNYELREKFSKELYEKYRVIHQNNNDDL
ncbi:uncharacterized protein ASCRUDRAFT_36782, partial [Ascoidea rubescens DSM 1968]